MKGIDKIAKVVAKILEIGHWVAAALMAAAAVCSLAAPQWIGHFVGIASTKDGMELATYGFEMTAASADGGMDMTAVFLFAIGAVIVLCLMAMVFRNLYLIIRKSEKSTPFQKDNVRMLREIGIFSISVPVVSYIMSIIVRLVISYETVETSIRIDGLILGIIVLCLTQFFAHGVELEKDVDGLV